MHVHRKGWKCLKVGIMMEGLLDTCLVFMYICEMPIIIPPCTMYSLYHLKTSIK